MPTGCRRVELAVDPVQRAWRRAIADGVRTGLPLIIPASPIALIRRATVQRAMSEAQRRNCRQTLRTPSTRKLASFTRRISILSAVSRRALYDGFAGSSLGQVRMVGRCGDRQQLADRLDPMDGAMIVDECGHIL